MKARRYDMLRRAVASVLALSMLLAPVAPFSAGGARLRSQPVAVPSLPTPAFNSADLDPAIAAATQSASSQPHWEVLVEQAQILLGAAWETQVDAAIAAEAVAVTQSDAYNANANYQQYLLNELVIQKEAAREQWMTAAERYIDQHRIAFLSDNNGDGDLNEFFEDSDDVRDQGAAAAQSGENGNITLGAAAERLERERETYRLRMRAHVEATYAEYQGALGRINADRSAYMDAIVAADVQFQQNLAQINAYEDQVRAGIQTLTTNLSNYLASSNQFYATTVNADNTLSVDFANMNAAGVTLQNLLNQVQTGLDNRDPLSTLATQLTTYLQNRQVQAQANATSWDNQIHTPVPGTLRTLAGLTWTVNASATWDPVLRDARRAQIRIAIDTDPQYEGVRYAIESLLGNSTNLQNYLRQGDRRTVSSVSNVSVCGRSPISNYHVAPGQVHTASHAECFQTAGYDFGVWDATALAGIPPVILALVGMFPEEEYHWYADYTLYDANAESNRDTWNTYDSQLGAMLTDWQNDVLPAIQNWETQSAQYEANYTAWQAQAATEVAAYNADYESSVARISAQRNYYLAQMDTEIRKGLGQFRELTQKLSEAESEEQRLELEREASLSREFGIAEFNLLTTESLREAYTVTLEARPQVEEAFLQRADQGVPDFKSFANAGQKIGETLSGALNIAVVEDLNDKAVAEQKSATDSLKAMLERSAEIDDEDVNEALEKRRQEYIEDQQKKPWKYVPPFDAVKEREQIVQSYQEQIERQKWTNVTVSDTGVITATRKIAKGTVTLRAGEDATQFDSYDVDTEEQTIHFQGAGAIKLGETAGLFSEEFDIRQANEDFFEDLDDFAEAFDTQLDGLVDLTSEANKSLSSRWSGAQKNIQNQVKIASTLSSLIQGIAGGGFNFAQWAQGVVQSEMAQVLEETFNVPAGFLMNLANGMEPGDAASSWLESAAYTFLEDASGIQGLAAFAKESIDKMNRRARLYTGNTISMNRVTDSLKDGGLTGIGDVFGPFALIKDTQFGQAAQEAPFKLWNALAQDLPLFPPSPFEDSRDFTNFVKDSHKLAVGIDRDRISGEMKERAERYVEASQDTMSLRTMTSVQPLTGLGNAVSAVLSPLMQSITPPERAPSQATLQMRETMGNTVAKAMNLPSTMTRMMLFEGASLEEAITAQAFADIEAHVGIPGIAEHYHRALERYNHKQRKDAAAAMRPEDYLTFGSTYLWRNAEYNKDMGVALQVAETVGGIVLNTVGNIIPGLGTGIWLAYNAIKQSYMGSLKGGTRGALAGYMSAGFSALSRFGVNLSVSYSYENGWGGSIGGTLPFAGTSLSGSAGLSFQEGEGVTGVSLGLSASSADPQSGSKTGYHGGIGLSFDRYGEFQGGNVNVGYTGEKSATDRSNFPDEYNVGGVLNFDREGMTGIGINGSGTNYNDLPGGMRYAHTLGGGLSINFDGSYGVDVNQTLGYNDRTASGLSGMSAGNSGQFFWDTDGSFQGVTNTISLGVDWQFEEEAFVNAQKERERVNELLDAETDPEKRKELAAAWNELNKEIKSLDPNRRENGWNEKLDALVGANKMSPEEADEIREKIANDPEAMNDEKLALKVWGDRNELGFDESRDSFFSQVFGAVGDGINYIFGIQSDEHGFVDDQGNYHERTCFVAGTLVRVKDGAGENGGNYKKIEDVRVGDVVLSWSERTDEQEWKQVSETFVRKADRVYKVEYDSGQSLETTWSHPFYILGKGWVEARKLRAGDISKATAGEERIASVTIDARHEAVYNFSVADNHNYFVGESGVLVHNSEYDEYPKTYLDFVERYSEENRWNCSQATGCESAAAPTKDEYLREKARLLYAKIKETHPDSADIEYLERIFGSEDLSHETNAAEKLSEIIAANNDALGAQFNITPSSDAGFAPEFQDPHESSRRQVGHFLTAVKLAFVPEETVTWKMRTIAKDFSSSDEELALQAIVGHELAPDSEYGGMIQPGHYTRQFERAQNNPEAVQAFSDAYNALGPKGNNWAAAERQLAKIPIVRSQRGNSREDLRLSLAGYWLGRQIREGNIVNSQQAANYISGTLRDHGPELEDKYGE
ncbi:MAG: TIGR04388 family protein [bacterium]|nr:TIGR04388 family protein [bacterium]